MKISTHSLLLIPFLLLFFSRVSEGNVLDKIVVNIRDGLDQKMNLTLRCQSKQDDLGIQQLAYDQVFTFRFRSNYWNTTQFYCWFKWAGSGIHWYDIYKPGSTCLVCDARITNGGPCFYNPNTTHYDDCKSWNNDAKSLHD